MILPVYIATRFQSAQVQHNYILCPKSRCQFLLIFCAICAVFDGKELAIYDEGEKVAEFAAVSGKPGYQSPEYQNKKDTGPIPEGTYVARKKDFQNRDDYGPIKKYTSWPGGERGWGKNRVWLEPSKETNVFGRGGFSIHGGAEPGSAGCIDLTSSMDNFTKWFENNGHDLIINVKY